VVDELKKAGPVVVEQGCFLTGEFRGGEVTSRAMLDKGTGKAVLKASKLAALEVSTGGTRPQQVTVYMPETFDLDLFKRGDVLRCQVSKFWTESGATKAYCQAVVKV